MTKRNEGVVADTVFVGATRPPMLWGVTYSAVMLNLVFVIEIFLLNKNPLTLLLLAPIHGVCMLLCARDPRFFDLLFLCARTRLSSLLGTFRLWKASSYSPLVLDFPSVSGRRKAEILAKVAHYAGVTDRRAWGASIPESLPRQGLFPSALVAEGSFSRCQKGGGR